VTLVFTDLADSSALLQKLGDQAGAAFLNRLLTLHSEGWGSQHVSAA